MHGHLEMSGPNHPKGGVQYRNQGPIVTQRLYMLAGCNYQEPTRDAG